MAGLLDFLPMVLSQAAGRRVFARQPEPSRLTDQVDNVTQYNQVMCTKLVVAYAAGMEIVQRVRPHADSGTAIDLGCGPGHYTLCLAKYLEYPQVTGVDLSSPMVELAQRNAAGAELEQQLAFHVGDATDLSAFDGGTFALSSFTDAAHHMPDLETVTQVLREMNRLTAPGGLVMVMDLARLKSEKLTERYVNLLGHDYKDRGLPQFFEDFRNSMYAAWTTAELRSAVPCDTQRHWYHIVPRGLPTIQILLGLPVGRKKPFLRPGFSLHNHPLIQEWYPEWERQVSKRWARETLGEYRMLRMTLKFGSKKLIAPRTATANPQSAITR